MLGSPSALYGAAALRAVAGALACRREAERAERRSRSAAGRSSAVRTVRSHTAFEQRSTRPDSDPEPHRHRADHEPRRLRAVVSVARHRAGAAPERRRAGARRRRRRSIASTKITSSRRSVRLCERPRRTANCEFRGVDVERCSVARGCESSAESGLRRYAKAPTSRPSRLWNWSGIARFDGLRELDERCAALARHNFQRSANVSARRARRDHRHRLLRQRLATSSPTQTRRTE